MDDAIAPEFARFISEERRASRLPAPRAQLREGEIEHPIFVEHGHAAELLRVAARRASGLLRPSRRTEVVWVQGDSELAVILAGIDVKLSDGLIVVLIPVRCDQTGDATVEVAFAVGTREQPAGLFASAYRRPNGPPLVVGVWAEALVAFAWQCVLGMIGGIAGATGKDARGNILVPVELIAFDNGIRIVPMARHRFAGSSGLRSSKPRGAR